MTTTLKIAIVSLLLIHCQAHDSTFPDSNHLKYFGFTLIDVEWDDPLDLEIKTNYLDEVADFPNIADILVITPMDTIISRLDKMENYNVRAILHLSELFFEQTNGQSPSGVKYALRSDYKLRWNTFMKKNNLIIHKNKIQAFYMGEEPTWNGISFNEQQSATDYVNKTLPEIPILIIEASTVLDELKIPNSVDWVGFDHYFIKDPKSNPQFLKELSLLKSKLVTKSQKLVLVLDAHYIQEIHGDYSKISQDEMKFVANSYYELAKNEEKVIALLGYTWPGGFDTETALGARQLPEAVKTFYAKIGKEITGKN